jgi:hypothetical protein
LTEEAEAAGFAEVVRRYFDVLETAELLGPVELNPASRGLS